MIRIICETEKLILQSEYEHVTLIDKSTNNILIEDKFYGDPECGLIDLYNRWTIIGGEYLGFWTPNSYKRIVDKELKWIHALRIKNSKIVEILTDPWSQTSAIWELNVVTGHYKKVKPFISYLNKPYTENVNWDE